jgi:acetoin utilization deacetylase AcuC-like enzyme
VIVYYCDHIDMGLPPEHRFPARKYRLLREFLERDSRFTFRPAPLATRDELAAAHAPGYVDRFLNGTLDAAAVRRIGFPWSPQLVQRTLASAGGTLAATRTALATGSSGALAGGTHHAFFAEGSGFCVFNDIAVAIAQLRAETPLRRFAIIDLDVHQGDGTAQIFAGDPDVCTLSLHGRNNFPFRKQQSTIDVALADGTGDAEYLAALRGVLPEVFSFQPEFVFYQAGVDPLKEDTLGKLHLTQAGLGARDRTVFEAAKAHGAPFVITLGGGYANPIELTAAAHAQTYQLAVEILQPPLARNCATINEE